MLFQHQDHLLEIETYNYNDATAELSDFDLANGDLTIDYASYTGNAVCLYSGDKDIDVEMELYGGSGGEFGGATAYAGGEGGYSKIRFTMERDVEYVLTGLFPAVNAPFLYRKASVIAIVGGGGMLELMEMVVLVVELVFLDLMVKVVVEKLLLLLEQDKGVKFLDLAVNLMVKH